MTLSGYTMAGTGEPVVLIHGSMNSKGQWRELSAQLEEHYSVIAIDLTGYGQTPFPQDPDNHSLMAEVTQIRQTVSALLGDHAPVHLVAHSYGGAVSLCYASHYPAEVQSLALFEPMANHLLLGLEQSQCFTEGRALVERIADLVDLDNAMAGARTFVDYFSGTGIFSMLPEKAQITLTAYVHKMLVDYRTTIETTLTIEDYGNIPCPICLITGDASTEVSLCISNILRDQIDTIRWVEVPGNHMAPIANPQAFNSEVIDWLKRINLSPPRHGVQLKSDAAMAARP